MDNTHTYQLELLPTLMKSKRLHWARWINEKSWFWLRNLMETDSSRKVYDKNPYAEVYKFRDNMYCIYSENCDGLGDIWQYLIIGPEKALLIDTGFGLGDLKGLCDELTGGMELIVVNTHDHFDHAYGNCRFNRVYCHEYCVPYLTNQHKHMWDYLFDPLGKNIWLDFERSALPEFKKYEITGVPDGHIFNLGDNYEVELIYTGGHAAGHAMLIDKKSRILYSGDGICSSINILGGVDSYKGGPYGETTLLGAYRERLAGIVERMDEYDSVFPAHYMIDLKPDVMNRLLTTVDAVLSNPTACDFKEVTWGNSRDIPNITCYKRIEDLGVVSYRYKGVTAD